MSSVILAFGANISGKYGDPIESMVRIIEEFKRQEVKFAAISSVYSSAALGASHQPSFYNFVALCDTDMSPDKLLCVIKQLERQFGRRGCLHWGPRPMDVDIIDFNRKIYNWKFGHERIKGKKILSQAKFSALAYPHKEMHRRAFVLKPLAEILPKWRHPVFGLSARRLLRLNCSPLTVKATEKLEISLKV